MNIADFFDLVEWQYFLLIFSLVMAVSIFLFRSCATVFYDPAWLAVLGMTTSVSLALYLGIVQKQGYIIHLLYIVAAYLMFLLGANLVQWLLRHRLSRKDLIDFDSPSSINNISTLRQILVILQFMLIALLLIRMTTQGLPILSDDPELAKVAVNTGGFGLITRLIGPTLIMSLAIVFLLGGRKMVSKRQMFLMLVPALLVLLSSGSKGALFEIIVVYVSAHVFLLGTDSSYRPNLKASFRMVLLTFIMVIGYAFLVLLIRGGGEASPLEFAIKTFGIRLIAYGDAVFYFFFNELYGQIIFQPIDYIWQYVLAPILAMMRLIEYPITLGRQIAIDMFGADMGGPNPTMFVEGYVYFGAVFGIVYAFLIGVLFQGLRRSFLMMQRKFNAWHYLWFSIFFALAVETPSDMVLFFGDLVNSFMAMSIVWFAHQMRHVVYYASKAI